MPLTQQCPRSQPLTMTANSTHKTHSDGWHRAGPYEFVHVTGWTITNRIVHRKSVWSLQLDRRAEGNFLTPESAMARHAELGQHTRAQRGD